MKSCRVRAVSAFTLMAAATAGFVVSARAEDASILQLVTWIGGVVVGAAGAFLLITAFPLRDDDRAEQPNDVPPSSD